MENVQTKKSKEIVLAYFDILFNKDHFDLEKMDALLDDNYKQYYDGHVRTHEQTYKHFKGHVLMKQTSDIEFVAMIAKDDVVFAHYIITSHKTKGGGGKWQVLAKFIVQNNKLISSDQLSEVLQSE